MKVKCGRGIVKECITKECSHWLELPMENLSSGKVVIEGHCLDYWKVKLQLENNKIMTGQQQAIESFRNEMIKPNPGIVALINLLAKMTERKKIKGD